MENVKTQKNPPPNGRGAVHVLCQLSEMHLNIRESILITYRRTSQLHGYENPNIDDKQRHKATGQT